ncbi:putative bardet-Biedl syndrome 2 protein [Plasmopara halstedii]
MLPAFQVHLHQPILERVAQVGKFDGRHPALACGTTAGKVFIHSPNENTFQNNSLVGDNEQSSMRFLKINRTVTALAAGKFETTDQGDTLVIGTQSSLLAYDVEKNSDIFYKDVPDGVSAMLFASAPRATSPLSSSSQMVVVGGNCSLQGFGRDGGELFWTVTGDHVRALTVCDVTGHGRSELVAGSDDFEIRAFQNEEAVFNCTETSVYKGKHRAWRIKSKNIPIAIHSFDIDGDGEKEIVMGWSNGKLESRKILNGEAVYKEMFTSPVAALVTADYRMDGKDEIICCSADGEIRGYFTATEVARLSKHRAALHIEMKALEAHQSGTATATGKGLKIRADTKIKVRSLASKSAKNFELEVSTENDAVIKMVIVFESEVGIFAGESYVVRPATMSSTVRFPLNVDKPVAANLEFKVLVGLRGHHTSFHVFECSFKVPKFAAFHHITGETSLQTNPEGFVRFKTIPDTSEANFMFRSLRDDSRLNISVTPHDTELRTDNMELAAELVQHMCAFLEWRELESVAEFPRQMKDFRNLLVKVDESNAIRLKLTGEMADDSNQVKNLIIRAEDSRILNDMPRMRQFYSELFSLNNQLLGEYTKRSTNHQVLLDALKEVNNMIQLAARLRFGSAKSTVIAACRKAIKNNNIHGLFHIVKTGKEEH